MDHFHTVYGFALLRSWYLPDIYDQIARDHYKTDVEKEAGLMMVRLADKTTNSWGFANRYPDLASPDAQSKLGKSVGVQWMNKQSNQIGRRI